MAHTSNLTSADFADAIEEFRTTQSFGSPAIFVGIVLLLTQRDRRFLAYKRLGQGFAQRESYVLGKEFAKYRITTTVTKLAPNAKQHLVQHGQPATDADAKSLEWLLDSYTDDTERDIAGKAEHAASVFLKLLANAQKQKSKQLEFAFASRRESNLAVIASELTASGIAFNLVTANNKGMSTPELRVAIHKGIRANKLSDEWELSLTSGTMGGADYVTLRFEHAGDLDSVNLKVETVVDRGIGDKATLSVNRRIVETFRVRSESLNDGMAFALPKLFAEIKKLDK
jgi:hypothetical protein